MATPVPPLPASSDETGLSPEISHPESGEPYGMFGTLREFSGWLLALAGACAGSFAVVSAWELFVHNNQKPAETAMVVIAALLAAFTFVTYKFAAFAREAERSRQRTARDALAAQKAKEAEDSYEKRLRQVSTELSQAREQEQAAWRERVSGLEKDRDGWKAELERLKAANVTPPSAGRAVVVASVRSLEIIFNNNDRPHRFECACELGWTGLSSATTPSPWALHLTGAGGKPLLATLTTKAPGKDRYTGYGDTDAIEEAISATMGQLTNTYPPAPGTFCEVEVRLAPGPALGAHRSSGVEMSFDPSATGDGFHPTIVRVGRTYRDWERPSETPGEIAMSSPPRDPIRVEREAYVRSQLRILDGQYDLIALKRVIVSGRINANTYDVSILGRKTTLIVKDGDDYIVNRAYREILEGWVDDLKAKAQEPLAQ